MIAPALLAHPVGRAFDSLAENYDEVFTCSLIGRAQRDAVWRAARAAFTPGSRILEINCGTGEDALFLARQGVIVFACDASEQMIAVAKQRRTTEAPGSRIRFRVLAIEQLEDLKKAGGFDGVFSNFSGLNCVSDLHQVARALLQLVKPGGRLLLCFSTRCCCWETLWFLARAQLAKAFRRWSGKTTAQLGGFPVEVRYPTIPEICRAFSPGFRLRSCMGIGITVPPSYLEPWARRHPKAIRRMEMVDAMICTWRGFRAIGDHVLLCFERCSA